MVAAEHREEFPGIIHDESATGKTVFEPEKLWRSIMKCTIFMQKDGQRFIKLSKFVPFIAAIFTFDCPYLYGHFRLDTIRAKTRLHCLPKRTSQHWWQTGFWAERCKIHYSTLDYRNSKGETIPFNLSLDKTHRFFDSQWPKCRRANQFTQKHWFIATHGTMTY